MTKKPSDFFSVEARASRRTARLNSYKALEGTLEKREAMTDDKITTQNAGVKAVAFVRDILNAYRLPGHPQLSYSGVRNGRTAANSSRLTDGVVTINASFKTYSNVGISFDVPIEINGGKLQEPSVIVHDGQARIIAQSTFDALVERSTIQDTLPVRELYSSPMPHQIAKDLYANRIKQPRLNRGMFSVSANSENLRRAMRGQKIAQMPPMSDNKPQLVETKHDDAASASIHIFSDGTKIYDMPNAGYAHITMPDGSQEVLGPGGTDNPYDLEQLEALSSGRVTPTPMSDADKSEWCSAVGATYEDEFGTPDPNAGPNVDALWESGSFDGDKTFESEEDRMLKKLKVIGPDDASKTAAPPVDHSQQDNPLGLQVGDRVRFIRDINEFGDTDDSFGTQGRVLAPAGSEGTIVSLHDTNIEVDCGNGMVVGCYTMGDVEPSQLKTAGVLGTNPNKPPKAPKSLGGPKPPKPPGLKSKPGKGLCSKCNHAPCVCSNKRKKKSDAELIASADFMSKVNQEVSGLRDDGVSDIDIKQAVLTKYGPNIAASIFNS